MKTIYGVSHSTIRASACVVIALAGVLVLLGQLWKIHAMWTPVGFVDTWPLYDRLMKLREGEASLDHYFFDPHGLHLHFIVYLLYLVDALLASGRQIIPHFATLFSIIGAIMIFGFVLARSYPRAALLTPAFCLLLSGTAVLLSGVSEATVIPFQTVVITSRSCTSCCLPS